MNPNTFCSAVSARLAALLIFGFLIVLLAVVHPPAYAQQAGATLRPDLPLLIEVSWKRLPNTPKGIRSPAIGIIGDVFISVGGFCSGEKVPEKGNVYPRGFFKDTFAFTLNPPGKSWVRLADFPDDARMGALHASVNNRLYVWGGLSYTAPYCYTGGHVLEKTGAKWIWNLLPPLPHPLGYSASCVIGAKIYAAGGCDYDRKRFLTAADRSGKVANPGKRLLVFDTENPRAGWKELSSCPGTGRYNAALAAVDGKLYLMGGATGVDSPNSKVNTVVDNWCYDPSTDQWARLADTPIANGNFPAGEIVYKNRYILLIGGTQYPDVQYLDGRIEKSKSFGQSKMFYRKYMRQGKDKGKSQRYVSEIFVYDTKTGVFGEATMLPFNVNMPKFIIRGDKLWLISGETGGLTMDGEYYGHNPDFFLEGTLQLMPRR